jgi:hypothetical protein
MSYDYHVSYNAVNKHIGPVFGDGVYTAEEKIESSEMIGELREHIADLLKDEYDRKFSVVILNFTLLREVVE